jgi:CRP-like cAMP-binding protein
MGKRHCDSAARFKRDYSNKVVRIEQAPISSPVRHHSTIAIQHTDLKVASRLGVAHIRQAADRQPGLEAAWQGLDSSFEYLLPLARYVGRAQQNIFVKRVVPEVRRRKVLKFVRRVGAVLAEQVAHYFGIPVEETRRLLDELVEKGELRAVEIAGLKFYFVNPKEAAEVILGSIKPD